MAMQEGCDPRTASSDSAPPDGSRIRGELREIFAALRGVGRIPEALAAFERTLALEDPTSTHVADRVETRLEYALALRSAGAETSAVAKIEEARALATASKDPTALAFLSSHPAVGSDSPGP